MSSHWGPTVPTLAKELAGLGLATRAAHVQRDAKANPRPTPLNEPIVNSGTYKFDSIQQYQDILEQGGYLYSRCGNPTVEAVECCITSLEGGAGTLVFSSGSATFMAVVLANVKSGEHIICCNPVYSGIHKILTKYIHLYNMEVSFVPSGSSPQEYEKLIKPNTRLVHVESPCNPTNSMTDLQGIGDLGTKYPHIITCVDSTFSTPILQNPIDMGLDLVIHSCTKYMNGHNDVIAGSVTTKTLEMWKKLNVFRISAGSVLSPLDANLLLRGLKTLPLRVERHCSNALYLARFLEEQDKVSVVYYPGLESFPQHQLATRQMKGGFGGMITFIMEDGFEAARKLVESVRVIYLAVSLGDVCSLMNHPASMTHGNMVMTDEDREEAGITPGMIRFSVGIEDREDLKRDLEQALDKV